MIASHTLHTTNSPPLSFVANSRRVAARQSPPPPWHPSPMMQGQPARLMPRSFEIGTPPVPEAPLDIGKLKNLKSGVAQGASNGPCTPHNKTESIDVVWQDRKPTKGIQKAGNVLFFFSRVATCSRHQKLDFFRGVSDGFINSLPPRGSQTSLHLECV